MTVIEFALPFATESLNVRDRKNRWQRHRDKRNMSMEVMAAIGGPRHFPRPPWQRVKITVVRCSSGTLDTDNLYASVKSLIDVLCLRSERHADNLGIITDDKPDLLTLEVKQSIAAPGHGSTLVRIEKIS